MQEYLTPAPRQKRSRGLVPLYVFHFTHGTVEVAGDGDAPAPWPVYRSAATSASGLSNRIRMNSVWSASFGSRPVLKG